MQLAGLNSRAQEYYARSVRQLAEYYGKPPDKIDEKKIRTYFLYVISDK